MSEKTKIQWTDHTFNPWIGCAKVSPGCANCYAEVSTPSRAFGVKWGTGQPRKRTSASNWKEPVRWNKSAICALCEEPVTGEARYLHRHGTVIPAMRRPRVFCASLSDWLDDEVPIEWLADLLKLIHDTPHLDSQLLTKRPENFRRRLHQVCHEAKSELAVRWHMLQEAPSNVWIGTTVEDQERAEERIPALLKIPARVRFLSVEPLLGEVNLDLVEDGRESEDERSWAKPTERGCGIDWVIVGGESGNKARLCNVEWIRSVVHQCQAAGVACFVKQLGAHPATRFHLSPDKDGWPEHVGFSLPVADERIVKLEHPKGGDMEEWPEDLRVREHPVPAEERAVLGWDERGEPLATDGTRMNTDL